MPSKRIIMCDLLKMFFSLRRTALMELQQSTQSKLSEYTDDDDDELNRADTSDKR